jgi:ankyrin repeat protein
MEDELFTAIEAKDFDKIKELIEKGVKINAKNKYGHTVLEQAIGNDDLDIIKYIFGKLEKGEITKNYYKEIVCHTCNVKIAEYLIENGANIGFIDEDGNTPLLEACSNYLSFEFIKLLIEKGSDVNVYCRRGYTPLMLTYRNFKIVKLLVEKGANIEVKDEDGNTVLVNAIKNKLFETAKYLITKGVNIEAKDEDGNTVLLYILKNWHNIYDDDEQFEILKLLIEKGANIDVKDKYEHTALAYAEDLNKFLFDFVYYYKVLSNPDLPENITCFDEVINSDILVKDFIKNNNRILIKFGDKIKGYTRSDIIRYYEKNKTLYTNEKLYLREIKKIKNYYSLFYCAIIAEDDSYVLIPQTQEKFFS